jgi:hypothetical protein
VKYTYLPQVRQARIDFDIELPHNPRLFDAFFPLGEAILNPDSGKWAGVQCSIRQWWYYINFTLETLIQGRVDPATVFRLWDDRQAFLGFMVSIKTGPFYKDSDHLDA